MPRPAITVENLSKAYHIGLKENRADTLVAAVHKLVRAPLANFRRLSRMNTFKRLDDAEDVYWALRDVSFEVAEGEVVGIIGSNGAGKSTLLKILSRITEPTRGRAVIRGRVSSLLEVGTGFHQELTGRENVYMNGTILGMTRREIDRKFDEIVDFSGVEKFLDTPIKHYSSGMKVRLAFSVAAHLEPEILIIDEVLAVGDAEFQKKCLGKMQDVARGGRTVLFVSHNMAAVEALCMHGIELKEGECVSIGDIHDVIEDYRRRTIDSGGTSHASFDDGKYIRSVAVFDANGHATSTIPIGQSMEVRFTTAEHCRLASPRFFVHITDLFGSPVLTVQTPASVEVIGPLSGRHEIRCRVHEFPLAPGQYVISAALMENREILEHHRNCLQFSVINAEVFNEGRGHARGMCVARSTWSAAEHGAYLGELSANSAT